MLIDASKGTPTDLNLAPSGGLFFQNNIIAGPITNAVSYAPGVPPTGANTASITAWVNTAAYANSLLPNNTDVALGAPFNYSAPDFNPSSSSPAISGASFALGKLTTSTSGVLDFKVVAYKGACGVGDTWWKNWTSFK